MMRSRRQNGFTLTEVLIATFITSVVMASIYGVITSIISARERLHELSLRNHIGPSILNVVEEDLQGLFGFNVWGDRILRGRDRTENGESADSLDLITTTDSMLPETFNGENYHSALSEVGYHLRPNSRESTFLELWRRESFHVDDDPFRGGTFTKLYDRVRSLEIKYFEQIGEDAEPLDEWDSFELKKLPRAIQIELVIEVIARDELNGQFLSQEEEERRTLYFERVISISPGIEMAFELYPTVPDLLADVGGDGEGDGGGDGGGSQGGSGGGGDRGGGGGGDGGGGGGGGGPGDGDGGGPRLGGGSVSGGSGSRGGGRTGVIR